MFSEDSIAPSFHYTVTCTRPDGTISWVSEFDNLITTVGKNDLLERYFKGASYTAAFFCGIINDVGYTGVVVGDTAASHSGWTESTAYTSGVRPAVTWGTVSGGSLTTSAASAFTMSSAETIKGAFVSTDSLKGGTSGVLYSEGLFTSGDRAVLPGDVLNVSITMNA